MINHIWSVLCRTSVIDGDTNALSIQDVLEELNIKAQLSPTVDLENTKELVFPVSFEITSMLGRDDDSIDEHASVKIVQYSPKNEILNENSNDFIIPKGMKRMRMRMKNGSMKVTVSGRYKFKVELTQENKKTTVATLPLEVFLDLQEA